jgi:hypothetical protein
MERDLLGYLHTPKEGPKEGEGTSLSDWGWPSHHPSLPKDRGKLSQLFKHKEKLYLLYLITQ